MAETVRAGHLRRAFGITVKQYDKLLADQCGMCAICAQRPKRIRLAVDHDHVTGFVRGLLCARCNRALAAFKDSSSRLNLAAQYIRDSDRWWDSLSEDEQEQWLPFKGRSSGKLRRKRITKLKPTPRLPQAE